MANKYEWSLRILGLNHGATDAEIKEAYRDLVAVWHPDKHTGNERLRRKAEEMLKQINAAKDYLDGKWYDPDWEEPESTWAYQEPTSDHQPDNEEVEPEEEHFDEVDEELRQTRKWSFPLSAYPWMGAIVLVLTVATWYAYQGGMFDSFNKPPDQVSEGQSKAAVSAQDKTTSEEASIPPEDMSQLTPEQRDNLEAESEFDPGPDEPTPTTPVKAKGQIVERPNKANRDVPSPVPASGEIYADEGGGHWISDVSSEGDVIELEDGSLWLIDGPDRVDSALWLATDDIVVKESSTSIGGYRLINTSQDETVGAKYIGQK